MSTLRERIEGLVASKRKWAEHVARVCTAESNQFRAGDIIAFCDELAAALVAEGQGDASERNEVLEEAALVCDEQGKLLMETYDDPTMKTSESDNILKQQAASAFGCGWAIRTLKLNDVEEPDFGTAEEVIAGLDAIKKHNDALAVSAIRAGRGLHKEPHKFPEYPHDDPTVLAIERGYRKWEEESSCHEIGCGCVTVWIWRELAALHKEGAGGAPWSTCGEVTFDPEIAGGDAEQPGPALKCSCQPIHSTECVFRDARSSQYRQFYPHELGRASPAGRVEQEPK